VNDDRPDGGSWADAADARQPGSDDAERRASAEVDALLADLRSVLAEAGVEEAVMARSRERWLRRQAEEEATMSSLLIDAVERGGPVVVRTVAGRSHHGRLTAVAADCCVLRTSAGTVTLLPLRAVTSLRHGPGRRHREAATSRRSPVAATFVGLLADLAGERPRVRLACDGNPDVLAGELRAAGADVLTLQQEADPPAIVYVRLASVTEVSLLGSG